MTVDGSALVALAPLRVSLAGGGTDLPGYAGRYGGLVVSLSINRYVTVATHPQGFESAAHDALHHGGMGGGVQLLDAANPFGRAARRRHQIDTGVPISSMSDAPIGSGLGGSGAFTVALLQALRAVSGRLAGPRELAEEASELERVDIGRPVGKHDHYMAAFGGVKILLFGRDLGVEVETIAISPALREYVDTRLTLFYTGRTRDSGVVLGDQDQRMRRGEDEVLRSLHGIRELASGLRDSLRSGRLEDIGSTLREHWTRKLKLSPGVSNRRLNTLVAMAEEAGAEGTKVLGAGGGGFLLVSAAAAKQDAVRAAMAVAGAAELPFGIEDRGARIVQPKLASR